MKSFKGSGALECLEARTLFTAGQVDVGFGTSGTVTHVNEVVPLHDGRLVVISKVDVPTDGLSVSFRTRDGATSGTFPLLISPSEPYSAARIDGIPTAVDARDRVFIATAGGVVCVLPNGTLDQTFGVGGAIGSPISRISSIFVQRDGKLVIGGELKKTAGADEPNAPVVVRFTSKGKRDATFGPKGVRFVGPYTSADDSFRESVFVDRILQDSQGRLIVGQHLESFFDGSGVGDFGDNDVVFKRLNADGSADASFPQSTGQTSFETHLDGIGVLTSGQPFVDVAIDRSDRLIVALKQGLDDSDEENPITLVSEVRRVKSDGTLDSTFGGGDGIVDDFFADDRVLHVGNVAVDALGRVLVAGGIAENGTSTPYVVRLRADGSIDTSFGTNGAASVAASSIALQPDGSILLGNTTSDSSTLTRVWADDAPTVNFDVRNIHTATSRSQTIDLTINDDVGVLTSTFGRDLRITGPNGFVAYARFDSTLSNTNGGRTCVVRYKLAAPGGSWDATDNGEYVVELINRSITDVSANGADGRVLGNFLVKI